MNRAPKEMTRLAGAAAGWAPWGTRTRLRALAVVGRRRKA
jgi:hypothetical protein